jgi:hypothetical protein
VEEVLRFLELCAAELDGVDARLEIGGEDPDDPHLVWHVTEDGFRLVVRFDDPPDDRDALTEKLARFAASFDEIPRAARLPLPRASVPSVSEQLHELLAALATRAGAERAVVVDETSPVIFGDSEEEPEKVSEAAQARLEAALDAVRDHGAERRCERDGDPPYLSRPFAAVYRVVLVFEAPFSEIRADGHLVRAMPGIEKKVMSLPPLDPKGGAKVRLLRPS